MGSITRLGSQRAGSATDGLLETSYVSVFHNLTSLTIEHPLQLLDTEIVIYLFDINAAAKLGIEPPPPYLSLSMNDDAILQGVNYASGGAGILNETGFYFVILSFSPLILKIILCLEG